MEPLHIPDNAPGAIIPPLRTEMLEYAALIEPMFPYVAELIRSWEVRLHRRPTRKRAPITHDRITAQKVIEVKAFLELHRDTLPNQEIGRRFNINAGRVPAPETNGRAYVKIPLTVAASAK